MHLTKPGSSLANHFFFFCCNWVARPNQEAHRRTEEAEGTPFLSVEDVGMCGWKGRVQLAALLGPWGRARKAPASVLRPSRYKEQYRPLNDSQDQLRQTIRVWTEEVSFVEAPANGEGRIDQCLSVQPGTGEVWRVGKEGGRLLPRIQEDEGQTNYSLEGHV